MMRAALTGLAVFASAVIAFVTPATGTAAAHPPSGNEPGVAQYTEMLPSAGGGQAAGSSTQSHKLPAAIQAKLKREGGSAASSLEVIASSAAYGAPQATHQSKPATAPTKSAGKGSKAIGKGAKTAGHRAVADQANASAASAAATSAGHGYVLAVVLALVLLTVAAATVTFARRRRRSA